MVGKFVRSIKKMTALSNPIQRATELSATDPCEEEEWFSLKVLMPFLELTAKQSRASWEEQITAKRSTHQESQGNKGILHLKLEST